MFKTRITETFASELFSSDSSPFFDDHGDSETFDPKAECNACGQIGCDPGRRELADRLYEFAMIRKPGWKSDTLKLEKDEAIEALWCALYYNEDKWQEWFTMGDLSAGAFVRVGRRIKLEIEDQHPAIVDNYLKQFAS